MKTFRILFFTTLSILMALHCGGNKQPIYTATSTSLGTAPIFDLLEGKKWSAEPGAEYVKIHLYFDKPVLLKEAELRACDKFDDNVHMFVNFDEYNYNLKKKKGDSRLGLTLETPVSARSVTFNLNRNSSSCLNGLYLWDSSGKKVRFSTPEIREGSIKPSRVSKGKAYHPLNLFDSRYETAWSSTLGEKDIYIDFDFAREVKITALKIWNGYQRSPLHCIRNGRVKTLEVTGDGNYSARVAVADEMDSQVVKLPAPFSGKHLRLRIAEIYRGELEGVIISELRFLNGDKAIMFDPAPLAREVSQDNKDLFKAAGLDQLLNRGLVSEEDTQEIPAGMARTVTAQGGLRIRETASTDAKTLVVAPKGSEVKDENETGPELKVGDQTGHWTKVTYEGKTGWAFDAFLTATPAGETRRASAWKLRLRGDGSLYFEGNAETVSNDYNAGKSETTKESFYAIGNFEAENPVTNEIELKLFGFVRKVEVSSSEYLEMGHDCNGCGRDCAQVKNNKNERVFIQNARLIRKGDEYYLINRSPGAQIPFGTLKLRMEKPLAAGA